MDEPRPIGERVHKESYKCLQPGMHQLKLGHTEEYIVIFSYRTLIGQRMYDL
jgi:hypothetical protein